MEMQFSSFNPYTMEMQKSFEFNSSKELSEYLLDGLGQNPCQKCNDLFCAC